MEEKGFIFPELGTGGTWAQILKVLYIIQLLNHSNSRLLHPRAPIPGAVAWW